MASRNTSQGLAFFSSWQVHSTEDEREYLEVVGGALRRLVSQISGKELKYKSRTGELSNLITSLTTPKPGELTKPTTMTTKKIQDVDVTRMACLIELIEMGMRMRSRFKDSGGNKHDQGHIEHCNRVAYIARVELRSLVMGVAPSQVCCLPMGEGEKLDERIEKYHRFNYDIKSGNIEWGDNAENISKEILAGGPEKLLERQKLFDSSKRWMRGSAGARVLSILCLLSVAALGISGAISTVPVALPVTLFIIGVMLLLGSVAAIPKTVKLAGDVAGIEAADQPDSVVGNLLDYDEQLELNKQFELNEKSEQSLNSRSEETTASPDLWPRALVLTCSG